MQNSGMWKGLHNEVQEILNLDVPVKDWAKEDGIADQEMIERLQKAADEAAAAKTANFTPDLMRQVEKSVLLQILDHLWREHLVALDHLRKRDRLSRLRPARSAAGIQDRELRAVPGHDG